MIDIDKIFRGNLMNRCLENCPVTLNTTSVCGDNSIDLSIQVSRTGFANMKLHV